jgi:NADH:ubiquinone oxidoreductase subunit E
MRTETTETTQLSFELSAEGQAKVKAELKRYEAIDSAIIPALYLAQKENNGWISPAVIRHLSILMSIPESKINEVFKFYTMFNQKPVGSSSYPSLRDSFLPCERRRGFDQTYLQRT